MEFKRQLCQEQSICMEKVAFSIDQPRDIPLAQLLFHTCPQTLFILIRNFNKKDQFKWDKRKHLEKCLSKTQINIIKNYFPKKFVISANSFWKYKREVKKMDILITRGRDIIVLKPIAKRNIALSLNRCYFSRILDVLPYYLNQFTSELKVFTHSESWLKEDVMSDFQMAEKNSYDLINNTKNTFYGIDILGYYNNLLNEFSKEQIKKEYGIPEAQKVAFVSFRKAARQFSLYRNNEEFIQVVKNNLEEFKKQGYFIVSRRRMGEHDIRYYKANKTPDLFMFEQVESLVDLELNENEGFPSTIWKSLYMSDFMFLPDISGICYVEAAICKCPVYMPYKDKSSLLESFSQLAPPILDMIEKDLVFNNISANSLRHFKDNIEEFLRIWYGTNVKKFWDVVLS